MLVLLEMLKWAPWQTCIFAYGQTGSGKTYTLEGSGQEKLSANADPSSDAHAGLIPRAVQMLWKTARELEEKGWHYSFEGQMLEIYNEGINDLLSKVRWTPNTKSSTRKAAPQSLTLPLLFTLRVRGQNATTMESCDAVLNLVDLAGSERLSNSGSGSHPARLKEAQCINKSLSSLADVIAALSKESSSPTTTFPIALHAHLAPQAQSWRQCKDVRMSALTAEQVLC
ncbi:hypothetical protein L7F22_038663 [Adiantum nelumboides]|nr:hypothetical protein [Adiantum nelumboides]